MNLHKGENKFETKGIRKIINEMNNIDACNTG